MIGIIGGSGLDDPHILEHCSDRQLTTSYGEPSSAIRSGEIEGIPVALVARHGRRHTIPPSQVNNRANIRAFVDLGCTAVLATTAVGSLREEIRRGDLVIIDQFIDFTRFRVNTFHDRFEPGAPVHTAMADPFSPELRQVLVTEAKRLGLPFHSGGTVITIEGPRFSTRAESLMFRSWGADVINMSIAPEVILANEAGIPYAAVAMSTDYDCWKSEEVPVSWDEILRVFTANIENVTNLLIAAVSAIGRA